MKFEYNRAKFEGTRELIIAHLKVHLDSLNLRWERGSWRLGADAWNGECGPREAKKRLTEYVIDSVPREYAFDGKIFESIMELKQHMNLLPLRYIGDSCFALGTYEHKFLVSDKNVSEIRQIMVKEIINEI